MVDTTQPASVQEFTAAGASPEQAANLVEQHEAMAGRRGPDARAALSIAARDQPPAPAPPPAAPPTTQAEAIKALAAHEEIRVGAHLDRAFAPPASAAEYQFPATPTDLTDEQFASDNAIKAALFSEKMPRFVVESVAKTLAEVTRTNETPDQAQARIASTRATLERWYGPEKDANLALVDALTDRLVAKGGAVRAFVETAIPRLDALSLDALVQFAKLRAGRRL